LKLFERFPKELAPEAPVDGGGYPKEGKFDPPVEDDAGGA
jgi:hypothetical protein